MSMLQTSRATEEQKQQMKNWEAIFPAEQITEQKSALFVKKLLAVAISNITYLRNIFPENAFGDKHLDDLNLKILRDESNCPGACQVIKWVKGCFDALDKKYLKTLVIGIYVDPNDPETVIESYTFRFSYDNDGSVDIYRNEKKISGAYSAEETKKATIQLLRTLVILTNTLSALPHNVMMTMKLFYYDEVTPKDYEPPGFIPSVENPFFFEEDATNVAIGSVSTAFHTVKLRIKTNRMDQGNNKENDANVSIPSGGLDKESFSQEADLNQRKNCDTSGFDSDADQMTVIEEEEDFKVRCPCGCNEDDGIMVMCGICRFWQHGTCFLITNEDLAPENHVCDVCAKPNDPEAKPTDPQLLGKTSIDVQGICLWRRTLKVITEFKFVVTPELARRLNIENTVAQGLINRLEKEGFISTQKGKGKKKQNGKVVNKNKIETEGVSKYLEPPNIESTEIVIEDTMESEGFDKVVSSLTDVTKKMNLGNGKKKNKITPKVNSQTDNKSQRANRKRSRASEIDFELASQEEDGSSCKKASKVQEDVTVY